MTNTCRNCEGVFQGIQYIRIHSAVACDSSHRLPQLALAEGDRSRLKASNQFSLVKHWPFGFLVINPLLLNLHCAHCESGSSLSLIRRDVCTVFCLRIQSVRTFNRRKEESFSREFQLYLAPKKNFKNLIKFLPEMRVANQRIAD